MDFGYYDPDPIRPEVAVELLAKNGVKISTEDAKKVLELLNFLVNLSVDQLVTP